MNRLSAAIGSPGMGWQIGPSRRDVQRLCWAAGWTLMATLSIIAPMAMLYRLDADAAEVAARFAARAGDDPWESGHIAPGRFAPVVTSGREYIAGPRPDGELPRRLVPRLWGVPPPPSAADPALAVLTVRNVDSPFWIGN